VEVYAGSREPLTDDQLLAEGRALRVLEEDLARQPGRVARRRYDRRPAGNAASGGPPSKKGSTMKTLCRLVLIVASSLLLGAVPVTAPVPFSMNFFGFTSSSTSADGTWSANGGISDVGSFTMSWTVVGGQVARLTATLVGKQGSITFSGTLRRVVTSPTDFELTGPIHLTGGTGFYSGIHGFGKAALVISAGSLTGAISGQTN
jgi:hypothetical protein